MSETPVELRVGDRERRVVDEKLQAAVGDGVLTLAEYDERAALLWQARTRTALDDLVADLPGDEPPARQVATVRTAPQRVVAVMSEDRLSGALLPGQEVHGYAVMGKAVLDLRPEDLPDGVRVAVRSLMGEVEVQVPPGSQVQLSGMAVMGERKVRVAPGDGPVVHVDAYALMGSVHVTSGDGTVLPAVRTPHLPRQAAPHSRRHDHAPAVRRPSVLRRLRSRMGGLLVPVAIVGGVVLAGSDNASVFGSGIERVRAGETDVEVSTLFGSVEVVVPDDVQVDTGGLVVFGSVDCERACTSTKGEVVHVRSVGAFGSVTIRTQSEHDQRRPPERLELDDGEVDD